MTSIEINRQNDGLVSNKYDGVVNSWNYGTKVCRCCEGRLKLELFSKDRAKKDGLRHICKTCESKRPRGKANKTSKSPKLQLSNEEIKQATLDFIFGKSDINPIKRI